MSLDNSFINLVRSSIESKSFSVPVPNNSNTSEVVNFLTKNDLTVTFIDDYFDKGTNILFKKNE